VDSSLWKVLGFIIAAVLLFLVPLMNILERQDNIAYTVVFSEANRFVDAARDTGYITPNMYLEFRDTLNATGNSYKISIRHVKSVVNPVYKNNGTMLDFTGEYTISRYTVGESEILATLFPSNSTAGVHDKTRQYTMKAGDMLFVEVRNEGKTMAAALRDMVMFTDTQTPGIFVRAGGMVRNEAD